MTDAEKVAIRKEAQRLADRLELQGVKVDVKQLERQLNR